MVAFLGLFEHNQILVEHFFLRESDAVKTCQLRPFFVATPIGTCRTQYFYGFNIRSVGQMRTPAKIGETALSVGGDGSVLQFVDQLHFVVFVAFRKHFNGIGLADALAANIFFCSAQLQHFLFDSRKIGFLDNDTFARIDIVIKSVFDSRADAEFDTRIQLLQRFGHEVSRRVPVGMTAFFVFPFQQLHSCIVFDRPRQIPCFAIHTCGKHFLRKSRTDTFGYF
jgi:hypothetical protein